MTPFARRAAAAGALLGAIACAETTGLTASNPVIQDKVTIYALTGTSPSLPSALYAPDLRAVRADGASNFDVAFDIDAEGKVLVYPMSLVLGLGADTHPVGLQKATAPFADVLRAPLGGYDFDDPLTLAVGEVAIVEATLPRLCGYPFPLTMYSKLVVDSVNLVARAIFLTAISDPNCGFRSFRPGVPVD